MKEGFAIKEHIEHIINLWDPIGLLAHAPKDEYNYEISLIYNCIKEDIKEELLAEKIYEIFFNQFNEVFNKNLNDCYVIAQKILSS